MGTERAMRMLRAPLREENASSMEKAWVKEAKACPTVNTASFDPAVPSADFVVTLVCECHMVA